MSYVNLHCHTHYSPMDGLSTISEYMQRCKEIGMTALAETEHGTLAGWREFQRETKAAGIKPILGVEAYFSPTDRWDRRAKKDREGADSIYNHLIILGKNDNGLKNLQTMTRVAWSEGFYQKARIDFDLLETHSEDLIVLSGCLNGPLAKSFEAGDVEGAYNWAKKFKDVFGDDFYIELQTHNPPEMNKNLITLADDLDIKPLVTDDCHHASPKDKVMQEIFLILSTNPKKNKKADIAEAQKKDFLDRFNYLYPERRMSFQTFDLYLEGYAEKAEKFKKLGFDREDLFANTVEVADKVGSYEYRENLETLPIVVSDPNQEIEDKVKQGLQRLGLLNKPEYVARAKRELGVIKSKNFANYFIIVADMISWAKAQGIRVGAGRGSAAGSLVCYALGITGVDPLKYNLIFERFLDEERADWPDIDIDVQDNRREEVRKYLVDKYEYVANITNINTYRGKKALKDAARVIGVPYSEVNKTMKILEGIGEVTGHDVIGEFKASPLAKDFIKKYPDVPRIAERLINRINGYGMHAAGVIIADKPIAEYAPIETRKPPKSEERVEAVALDKNECENLGLIKMDLLGLKTLSVVDDAVKLIKENKGILVDPNDLDLDDKRVFEMLSEGRTLGVFQAEESASTKLIEKMGIHSFNDLVVSNALVRPGAWNAIGEDYLAFKSGKRKPEPIHPDVESYMAETFYQPIYQEQMMRLSVDLAGFTVGESNKLRKGIGKKNREVVDSFHEKFVTGAQKKISREKAEKLWKSFEEAGAYAFNLSHAVAYSLLSYATAWLKVHYPQEFMCALLRNEKKKVTDYLLECKRMGIKVKLPHINHSQIEFSIDGNDLRMGLENVKYISEKLATKIIKERPYGSYEEFKEYVLRKGSGLNTRVLQALNSYGGASFKDHPVPENYKENLYEYLGVPAFDSKMVTTRMQEQLRKLEDYTDDETFICMAMVKNVKRGEGSTGRPWCLVELLDSSGSAGIFTDPKTEIDKGQMYLFLVSNNSIIKAISLANDSDAHENIILDFLRRPVLEEVPEGQYKIIAATARKTNKGGNMATLIVSDYEKNLQSIVVFDKEFDKARMYCKIGAVRTITTAVTRSGSVKLEDVY